MDYGMHAYDFFERTKSTLYTCIDIQRRAQHIDRKVICPCALLAPFKKARGKVERE